MDLNFNTITSKINIRFIGAEKHRIKTTVILGNIRNPCQSVLLSTVKFAYVFS